MSKSKKNKKRNKVNHTDNKNKFNRKKAITVTVVLLVIVVAVVALIFTMHNKANDIVGTDWVSSSAVNASGDEVEMAEVYIQTILRIKARFHLRMTVLFRFGSHPAHQRTVRTPESIL